MFSVANLVTLWKDAPGVGYLYGLEQEMQEFGILGMFSGHFLCPLSMLSSVFVWLHDLATHSLVQYFWKIMKNCIPSYSFHYMKFFF